MIWDSIFWQQILPSSICSQISSKECPYSYSASFQITNFSNFHPFHVKSLIGGLLNEYFEQNSFGSFREVEVGG